MFTTHKSFSYSNEDGFDNLLKTKRRSICYSSLEIDMYVLGGLVRPGVMLWHLEVELEAQGPHFLDFRNPWPQ